MSSYGEDPLGSQFSRAQESYLTSITTSGTSYTAPTAPSISLDQSSQNAIRSFLDFRATQGNRIASLEESTKSLAVLQAMKLGCNQEEREHWRSHRDAFCTAFIELLAAQTRLADVVRPPGQKSWPTVNIQEEDPRLPLVQDLLKWTDQAGIQYYRLRSCNHPMTDLRPKGCEKIPQRSPDFSSAMKHQKDSWLSMMSDARKVSLVIIKTKRLHEVFLANDASEFSLMHVPKITTASNPDTPPLKPMRRHAVSGGVFEDGRV
jgi:hypothetical protein